jgi:uncharacterized membrane protein
MKTTKFITAGVLAVGLGIGGCAQEAATPAVSFANDVQPILTAKCVQCHEIAAEGVATSGLNLTDYDGLMKGTKFGPVVVANSSESSALYLVVAHKTAKEIQMPPVHAESMAEGRGTSLTSGEIETIQLWIDQGALNN